MGPIQSSINSMINTIGIALGGKKLLGGQKAIQDEINSVKNQEAALKKLEVSQSAAKLNKATVDTKYAYLQKNPNLGGFGNMYETSLKEIMSTSGEATEAGLKGTDRELKALDLIKANQLSKVCIDEEFDEVTGGKK